MTGTRTRRAAPPPGDAPHGPRPRREEPTHLVVGRVLAPWGVRGEFRAEILTQFPERFGLLREITVGEEHRVYRLQSARLHRGNVILKLEGIDTPEQAGALRGELLYVPTSEAMPLEEHEYYHHQILGLDVFTVDGEYLGTVSEILETGSNDVYVVAQYGREILIPALADVVQEVDLERQRLIVALPPGLMDEEEA